MTHTPGPWNVCGAQDGKCPCSSVLYRDGVICDVRDCYSDMADATGHAPSPEAKQANKHLISAAPEMLAVLKALDARGFTQATWALAEKAIAKAEGRS